MFLKNGVAGGGGGGGGRREMRRKESIMEALLRREVGIDFTVNRGQTTS